MNIFRFSVGSEAKRVAVRCVFAIGVVCWANSRGKKPCYFLALKKRWKGLDQKKMASCPSRKWRQVARQVSKKHRLLLLEKQKKELRTSEHEKKTENVKIHFIPRLLTSPP